MGASSDGMQPARGLRSGNARRSRHRVGLGNDDLCLDPSTSDVFNDPNNWNPSTQAPGSASTFNQDVAEFGKTPTTMVAIETAGGLWDLAFDAGAPAYTFTIEAPLSLYGAGILTTHPTHRRCKSDRLCRSAAAPPPTASSP